MIKGSVASLLPLALVAAVGMASAQPRGWRHVPSIMRSVPSVRCTLSAGSPGINGDKMTRSRLLLMLVAALVALGAWAADYPAPQEGSWVVRDFRFHTGETLRELRLHYTTVGARSGEPVLVLHGTTGSGAGFLTPAFAGELFGPGKSTKPSDGMRMSFPKYNYDDMVDAQHRLVREHLGVKHLRLVIGNSMGGMQTWIWAQKYPDFMDLAVPMASLPTE